MGWISRVDRYVFIYVCVCVCVYDQKEAAAVLRAAEVGMLPRTGGSLDDTGSTSTFVEIEIVDAKIENRAADGVIIRVNVAIDGLVPSLPPSLYANSRVPYRRMAPFRSCLASRAARSLARFRLPLRFLLFPAPRALARSRAFFLSLARWGV